MKTTTHLLFAIFVFLFPVLNVDAQVLPNGSFEIWDSAATTPIGWATLEPVVSILGVSLSARDSIDKVDLTASIKLTSKSVLVDTAPGVVSVGGPYNNQTGEFPGMAFHLRPDTLSFYYKYEPVGDDTAGFQISLKVANGIYVLNFTGQLPSTNGQWASMYLPLSGYYTDGSIPDTLQLLFFSSNPTGENAIPGSVLHVDAVSFGGGPYMIELGSNQAVCNGSVVTLNPGIGGGQAPYTYIWSGTGNNLSCNNCKNPVVTLTQNSTYSVTIIDANNVQLSDTISYSVSGGTNMVQFSVSNTNIDCQHALDTTIVTVTGGASPFTFNWGDGSSVTTTSPQQHVYSQAGTHIIAVTDAGGCITSALDTIVYNGIIISPVQMVRPICINQNTGKLKVAAGNGTPPYSYLWSSGSVTDSAVNIHAGLYLVTVTDAASCSASAYYNLAPVAGWGYYVYMNPSATSCNNSGSIALSTEGGTPPFAFSWSSGQTTQNIANLSGGIYYITVTDSLGCSATGHATVPSSCYSTISGTIFNDTNGNCVRDGVETSVPHINVRASSNGQTFYGNTNANGTYSIQVSSGGTYTLNTYTYGICGNINLCNNPTNTVTIAVLGDTSAGNNFSVASSSGFDLNIHPGWRPANPGFTKDYWIYCGDNAAIPFSGQATVTFNYDANLIYQSSDPVASHNLESHTLTWQVSNFVSNGGFWDHQLRCSFLVPLNLGLGYLLQSDFKMVPLTGDCDTSNNMLHIAEITTGSRDPNEKKVEPSGSILEEDSMLTYTIGFQNTGTDSTHFIIIKDTLSTYLDASSVRNIASSHAYSEFNISGKGILTWIFNPLRLVDSFTNELGSHGFVKFTVKKKTNMPIGSTISNKAHIYFDYNEPVVTNTVADTISEPNSVFEVRSSDGIMVKAFPNPFTNATNIVVDGLNERFDFELFDVTGRLKRKIVSIETRQFQILRDDLATGVYFFKILGREKKKTGYGKLVVE